MRLVPARKKRNDFITAQEGTKPTTRISPTGPFSKARRIHDAEAREGEVVTALREGAEHHAELLLHHLFRARVQNKGARVGVRALH